MCARQAIPAVDGESLLEVAGLARLVDEVPECGSTLGDGFAQHRADRLRQPLVALPADTARSAPGVDAGTEQGLVGIDIPDADD